MEIKELESRIQTALADADMEIEGEDCSFTLHVVSSGFEGLNTLKRQQKILGLFSEELASGALHALTVKASTPAELSEGNRFLVQIDGL